MIYLIWQDYDGVRIEESIEPKDIENRLSELQRLIDRQENGTTIIAVIKGEKLRYETVEVATKIQFRKDQGGV